MKINTVVITGFMLAIGAFANSHTALNGTWVLEPTQSDFSGQPVMQTGTVTINERQGDITVIRDFQYEGANSTFFYKDMIDSENNATIHGRDVKSKAKWDHDVLKVTSTRPSGAVTVERYTLASNGSMTVSVDRPGSKPITLVFVRK
jgi:hypothetical protein